MTKKTFLFPERYLHSVKIRYKALARWVQGNKELGIGYTNNVYRRIPMEAPNLSPGTKPW